MRGKLRTIIDAVFYYNSDLMYIQGFHDICIVFLLVGGLEMGFLMAEAFARRYLRDYLTDD